VAANQLASDSVPEMKKQEATLHSAKRWITLAALATVAATLAIFVWSPLLLRQRRVDRITLSGRDLGGVITVAQSGQATVRSIGHALEQVAPGGVIEVLDDATYEESIRIADRDRF